MWNKIYPELSGSYPESANSKSQNPESGIGGKMPIGRALNIIYKYDDELDPVQASIEAESEK